MKKMIFIITTLISLNSRASFLDVNKLPRTILNFDQDTTDKIQYPTRSCHYYCREPEWESVVGGLVFRDKELNNLLSLATYSDLTWIPRRKDEGIVTAKENLEKIATAGFQAYHVSWSLDYPTRKIRKRALWSYPTRTDNTGALLVCEEIEQQLVRMSIRGAIARLPDYVFTGLREEVLSRWQPTQANGECE